jgi:hypothetical protein
VIEENFIHELERAAIVTRGSTSATSSVYRPPRTPSSLSHLQRSLRSLRKVNETTDAELGTVCLLLTGQGHEGFFVKRFVRRLGQSPL